MPLGARIRIAALAVLLARAAVAADPASDLSELSERLSEEPFELTADSLHYDIERELYIGRGNVVIKQSGRTLRADWVAFNRKTGAGLASGNVQLEDAGDVVTADFVEFELETIQGVLHGARLESQTSRFRASAAEIAKTGAKTYSFRKGRFTTCRCPDPNETDPWVLESEEAELEVEGYATARNTTFEVFGVPVAWIPWMIFPVKTERQTGLLFPEFSLGAFHGLDVGLPFFWAINDQAGLVLTPRYSVKRGPGGAARFDYAAGQHTDGEMQAAYYRDLKIDAKTPEEPFGRNRWSSHGVHDWSLPSHLRFETNYRFSSDNEVPFDFRELSVHRADRFLESEAVLSRSVELGRTYASVGGTFVDDLQNPDDLDRDRFLLQRWPTTRVDVLPGGVPGASFLVPSLDVEYTRFAARKRAEHELPTAQVGARGLFLDTGVDALPNPIAGADTRSEFGPGETDPDGDDFLLSGGTEGDERYQEGEPLTDRGHRLMLQPRLALPLDWRGVSLVPEVGWHETLYDSRIRDFRQRGFVTTRVDLSTRLRRQFENFVHVLEPRMGYALAYTRSQDRNALFVPETAVPLDRVRALDLDLVTRDDADRIGRASSASAGFGNRLYGTRGSDAHALLADVMLLGLYDAQTTQLDALIVDGRAYPSDQLDLGFHADFDPHDARIDEGLAEVRWNRPGVALHGGYRWARRIPLVFEDFREGDRFGEHREAEHINQIRGGASLDLTARWSVSYGAAYSIEGNRSLANQGLIEYLSRCGCWALGVELQQDRKRGVDAKLVYRLVGLGGEPPRPRPSLLDGT
jgi:lipopolysaccharide assembly outer membrane protein LptD (OstA)